MSASKQLFLIILTLSLATFASTFLVMISGLQAGIFSIYLVVSMALACKYPRLGLWIFLVYLPFGGTITYSIAYLYKAVNGNSIAYKSIDYFLFHLAKDAIYFPALIGVIISSQSLQKLQLIAKPLILALFGLLIACLLTLLFINLPQQLATPHSKALLVGLISLKTLIGYTPLILCGYYLIRNQKDLFLLNRSLVILTLICCGLCFIQYFLLVQGICPGNSSLPEPAYSRATLLARCFVGGSLLYNPDKGLIRLPGTFVAPWQWGWFLISNSFFAYGASLSDPSRRWRWISWIAVGTLLATATISGQRVAFLCIPIIFLVLLLLTESNRKQLPLKLGAIAFLGILTFANIEEVRAQFNSLVGRWNYAPPVQFVFGQFHWVLAQQSGWLGRGLGWATNAARRLGDTVLIETFYAKLLYEIGWLGTISFLVVVSVVIVLSFKAYQSLQTPSLRRLAICFWVFIVFIGYNTYYYPLSVDPVGVYYWLIAGVMLKLPELERQENL
jgi:hypothetical protein